MDIGFLKINIGVQYGEDKHNITHVSRYKLMKCIKYMVVGYYDQLFPKNEFANIAWRMVYQMWFNSYRSLNIY